MRSENPKKKEGRRDRIGERKGGSTKSARGAECNSLPYGSHGTGGACRKFNRELEIPSGERVKKIPDFGLDVAHLVRKREGRLGRRGGEGGRGGEIPRMDLSRPESFNCPCDPD